MPSASARQSQKSFLGRHQWKIVILLMLLILCGTVFIVLLNKNIISFSLDEANNSQEEFETESDGEDISLLESVTKIEDIENIDTKNVDDYDSFIKIDNSDDLVTKTDNDEDTENVDNNDDSVTKNDNDDDLDTASGDDDSTETENDDKYQWISHSYDYRPSNLVSAGFDEDGSSVSVICAKDDNDKLVIGKYASRGDAYIYNRGYESGISDFKFLSAVNYSWKKEVSTKKRVYADSVKTSYACRVKHNVNYSTSFNIPGFVDENKKCKYSYGNNGYESDNIEILSVP